MADGRGDECSDVDSQEGSYDAIRRKNGEELQQFLKAHGLSGVETERLKQEVRTGKRQLAPKVAPTKKARNVRPPPKKVTKVIEHDSGRRELRPRRRINYDEEHVPNSDDFIYCDICRGDFYEGCDVHPATRNDDPDILIARSSIRGAGRGVYNKSKETIPIGTLFGPYTGTVLSPKEYEEREESGYAWELLDSSKEKVVGFIDPGKDPNPATNWLAMVNSANYARDQNISAVQFRGQIMYRVCRPIYSKAEFFTYYGDDYAKSIGIDPRQFRFGVKNKEFWDDVDKVDEKRPHVCDQCGKRCSQKGHLEKHVQTVHLQKRNFACDQCDKTFGEKPNLRRHIVTVHERRKAFVCSHCQRSFGEKGTLNRHITAVHSKAHPHKCCVCLKGFWAPSDVLKHMKAHHKVQWQKQLEEEEKATPFVCNLCSKRFETDNGLHLHFQKNHCNEYDK